MAVAVQIDIRGYTPEQQDQAWERGALTSGGPGLSGMLFHWSTATAEGMRMVDVWEEREAFDKLFHDQLVPSLEKLGLEPPAVQYFEVHKYLMPNPTR